MQGDDVAAAFRDALEGVETGSDTLVREDGAVIPDYMSESQHFTLMRRLAYEEWDTDFSALTVTSSNATYMELFHRIEVKGEPDVFESVAWHNDVMRTGYAYRMRTRSGGTAARAKVTQDLVEGAVVELGGDEA